MRKVTSSSPSLSTYTVTVILYLAIFVAHLNTTLGHPNRATHSDNPVTNVVATLNQPISTLDTNNTRTTLSLSLHHYQNDDDRSSNGMGWSGKFLGGNKKLKVKQEEKEPHRNDLVTLQKLLFVQDQDEHEPLKNLNNTRRNLKSSGRRVKRSLSKITGGVSWSQTRSRSPSLGQGTSSTMMRPPSSHPSTSSFNQPRHQRVHYSLTESKRGHGRQNLQTRQNLKTQPNPIKLTPSRYASSGAPPSHSSMVKLEPKKSGHGQGSASTTTMKTPDYIKNGIMNQRRNFYYAKKDKKFDPPSRNTMKAGEKYPGGIQQGGQKMAKVVNQLRTELDKKYSAYQKYDKMPYARKSTFNQKNGQFPVYKAAAKPRQEKGGGVVDKNKNEMMLGALEAKFKNRAPFRVVTVSGDQLFTTQKATKGGMEVGKREPLQLKKIGGQKNGFTFINRPAPDKQPVFNVHSKKSGPACYNTGCAAQKMTAELGNHMKANPHLKLVDKNPITMYESWQKVPGVRAVNRNWDSTAAVKSCASCQKVLPEVTKRNKKGR